MDWDHLRSPHHFFWEVREKLQTVSGDLFTLSFCESTTENWMINDFWRLGIKTQDPENISKAIPKI